VGDVIVLSRRMGLGHLVGSLLVPSSQLKKAQREQKGGCPEIGRAQGGKKVRAYSRLQGRSRIGKKEEAIGRNRIIAAMDKSGVTSLGTGVSRQAAAAHQERP